MKLVLVGGDLHGTSIDVPAGNTASATLKRAAGGELAYKQRELKGKPYLVLATLSDADALEHLAANPV